MKPLLLALPDELTDWRGTAAELADKLNAVLRDIPSLAGDAGSANERLVRHYVQVGVLTAPDREGREALFGLRQIVEFLAARYLLNDGWPLAKVAELVRATGIEGLAQMVPAERPRTRAEEVVGRYRQHLAPQPSEETPAPSVQHRAPAPGVFAGRGTPARQHAAFSLTPERASPLPRAAVQQAMQLQSPLAMAADISRRRLSLEETLKALGNAEGRPDRTRLVRIELTPWCHVHVDAAKLAEMGEETPDMLGAALTQALQEERIQKGK